ncbi:beta-N-acetylhexosaminidase [Variovorax boronicumulans]|uniref:beta-N-acetylhexosaminidase n=1 Tax=Variovorax boronicumulans TaxID=436515 RepID=UPI00277DA306|nr:beta-N-acetylhexosaminidase [Variovorax boronicumulans]MDQ0016177.1 beta-N-acetylhexosaminidase [Variovorax boronicumulans]
MTLTTGSTIHAPLIIDVAGTELNDADRRRLANPLVGGVIHFTRNWQDRAQMTALNAEIKAIRPDLLICVDHEGGRVQRFRTDGFTRLPSMRSLGELWMRDAMRATQAATAAGQVLAGELRACGVDFSFAPVLDLDYGGSSVIGNRSFHRDPRVVALLAKSVMHGMLQMGMRNCGKHFPGHGFVNADSHVEIPVDRRSLKAILADDARPYDWLAGTLAAVMPAHVIYPKVDARPAGFSSKWLQDVLRTRLGFDGVIFSDDLSMEAGRYIDGELLSFTDAALAALEAGCDLPMVCNQSIGDGALLDGLLEGFGVAATSGRWQGKAASEARRQSLLPQAPALNWHSLTESAAYRGAKRLLALAGLKESVPS